MAEVSRKDHVLDGHTNLYAASLHVVRKHLRRLRQCAPGVLAGTDPESIHDMRTAVRRLRTTLRVLEEAPVARGKSLRALRYRLRDLADALGAVRDADVLLARLQEDIAAHPDLAADVDVLRRKVRKRQRRAHRRLVRRLRDPSFTCLLERLNDFVAREPTRAIQWRMAVRHFAGGAIWRRYETVLSYEALVGDGAPAVLHKLRITCKRLRYTLEIFEPELGKDTQPLLQLLTRVQDHLGALQDTVVALNAVKTLLCRNPNRAGLATYAELLAHERDRLQTEFAPLWSDLGGASASHELAALIAGL